MGPRRKAAVKTQPQEGPASQRLPLELQQLILYQFRHAYRFENDAALKSTIQEVKGHLYDRDFATAFGKQEYLQAYALRWSASRALGYAEIFSTPGLQHAWQKSLTAATGESSASRIICIGGGAGAEVAALASALHDNPLTTLDVTAIDIADWSSPLHSLHGALTTAPPLSAYASDAVKVANKAVIEPDRFHLQFIHQDILECKDDRLQQLFHRVSLCTIMFTLNELFTSSIATTTAFLLRMTEVMELGSQLLVVDSPGSYSEIKLGKEQKSKQYPMKWLLDHTLLEVAANAEQGGKKWEKVISDDSKWFRMSPQLKYPIELENMRYQIHLYRRLDSS